MTKPEPEKEVELGAFASRAHALKKAPTKKSKTPRAFDIPAPSQNGSNGAHGNGAGDDDDQRQVEAQGAKRREVVEALNREYALVLLGASVMVMRERRDPVTDLTSLQFLTLDAFRELLRPRKLWVNDKPTPYSTIWLNSLDRRQYDGVLFEPRAGAPDGYYNLWRGWAVLPDTRGEHGCATLLDHIYENVCAGDDHLYAWVLGWLASIVQTPEKKTGTSLVLRGPQGAGKTLLGQVMGRILGEHYYLVSDRQHVTGRFNSHLQRLLLLQVDEATWGDDRESTGKLKDLITGETQVIELKGKEPIVTRNYLRLLITSNLDWVVPAGLDERRFAVLDVAGDRAGDRTFFGKLHAELEAGGAACFLHVLKHFDLGDLDLRTVPSTAALQDQQEASLSTELAWWLDILNAGELPGDYDGDGRAPTRAIVSDYLEYARVHGERRPVSDTSLGRFLRKQAKPITKERRSISPGSTPVPFLSLPVLAECRLQFAKSNRHGDMHTFDREEEWHAAPPLR